MTWPISARRKFEEENLEEERDQCESEGWVER